MDNRTDANFQLNLYTLILLTVILVITYVFYALYQSRRTSKRGVLLTGLCDSGKTVLFSHLIAGKYVDTQTSMKENVGSYLINNKGLQIIDIPGYERLRGKFFDKYKSSARGVMYIIDCVTIQKDIRDAAEYLYNILSDPIILKSVSSMLIVCNKQDIPLAKSTTAVRCMFEKELNALRLTKASQLAAINSKNEKHQYLGKEGIDFSFSTLQSIRVEFIEASGSADNINLNEVKKWLSKLCS